MIAPSPELLMILLILLPLAGGILCFVKRKIAATVALLCSVTSGAIVFLLARHLLSHGPLQIEAGGWPPPLGIRLALDGASCLLLLMTTVTGLGVTLYGRAYFSFRIAAPVRLGRHEHQSRSFWPLWLFLWAGLNALFLAGDLFNIYVTLEVVSIAAVALASLSGKPASQIAALRYLLVSLLGSMSYLLGTALIYRLHGTLDLSLLHDLMTRKPVAQAALVLISVGLLLKTAVFPLHFWLPPAHANALAPVSAILSALVVKASFYLLFRLWFETFATLPTPAALALMGVLGSAAVLWGGIQAMRQQRLKLMVAYSTVSQLGYLLVAFPLARTGDVDLWSAVLFMAMGHAWAKAAMFMTAGAVFLLKGHDRIRDLAGSRSTLPIATFAYAMAGVNLMGLPPTGGFVAKWLLISRSLTTAQPWWGIVILAGSLIASAYVFRVVSRFFVAPDREHTSPPLAGTAMIQFPGLMLATLSLLLGLFAPIMLELLHSGHALIALLPPGGGP